MGFFDDLVDNPKTTLATIGGASFAMFVGYLGYQKYNEKKVKNDTQESHNWVQKPIGIKQKKYICLDLLLEFSYPSNFSVQKIETKDSGCSSIKIYNPLDLKEEISIICEYITPDLSLEQYYQQSVQHLKTTINIQEEERIDQKIRNFDCIYFAHSLQENRKNWRIIMIYDNRAYLFQSDDQYSDHFNLFLNTFSPMKSHFEIDKLKWNSKYGYSISIPDLTFQNKSIDSLKFESKFECISLETDEEYEFKENVKEESKLLSNNLKGKLITFEMNNLFYYEFYFKFQNSNYLMKVISNLSNRKDLLINSLESLEFNKLIERDFFIYKNKEMKFSIQFGSQFHYFENPKSNEQFLTLNKQKDEFSISFSKIKISNNHLIQNNILQEMKQELKDANFECTVKKELKTIISNKECGIIEFEYIDDIENTQRYFIIFSTCLNDDFYLKIEALIEINEGKMLKDEIVEIYEIFDSLILL
eukprot:gene9371-1582_t